MALTIISFVHVDDKYLARLDSLTDKLGLQVYTTGNVYLERSIDGVTYEKIAGSDTAVVTTESFIVGGLIPGMKIRVVSDAAGTVKVLV